MRRRLRNPGTPDYVCLQSKPAFCMESMFPKLKMPLIIGLHKGSDFCSLYLDRGRPKQFVPLVIRFQKTTLPFPERTPITIDFSCRSGNLFYKRIIRRRNYKLFLNLPNICRPLSHGLSALEFSYQNGPHIFTIGQTCNTGSSQSRGRVEESSGYALKF